MDAGDLVSDVLNVMETSRRNRGNPHMVFDWVKAAKLIKERNTQHAEAGLRDDWAWTGGTILRDGKIVDDEYTYLASNWATPLLYADGEEIECYVMLADSEWTAGTQWPPEARAIMEE